MIGALVAGITGSGGASLSSYESIASTTATSGSSVTFSSIPSTFKHLQVRILAKTTANYKDFRLTINGTTSTYASHFLYGTGTAAAAAGYTGETAIRLDSGGGFGLTSFQHSACIVDILDYASTTKNKTVRTFYGGDFNTTGGEIYVGSGLWVNTNAITELKFEAISGTYANPSYFALYGIKEA